VDFANPTNSRGTDAPRLYAEKTTLFISQARYLAGGGGGDPGGGGGICADEPDAEGGPS